MYIPRFVRGMRKEKSNFYRDNEEGTLVKNQKNKGIGPTLDYSPSLLGGVIRFCKAKAWHSEIKTEIAVS